jgi:hypothetical protein
MGGKGGSTVGYHYIMTMLDGLWRGPIDALLAIEADKKIAWSGSVSDATPTAVNKPDLFGGEDKEGGLQGGFILLQGARDQVVPGATTLTVGASGPVTSVTIPDIRNSIETAANNGKRVSQLRGFVSLVWRGLLCSMNPYPKEWHFLGTRSTKGWFGGTAWYPEKATICLTTAGGETIKAMNPAHMIYQVLTDPEWGAARSTDAIDENSFILAANTLCDEGFGLCFNWTRQEDVDTFIQTVIDHISGVLYTDPSTGLLVLRLIRNDYDAATLPLYDENSGLLEIVDDDSAAGDEAINEIIVKGKDQSLSGLGNDFEVRAHNIAANQAEGAISQTIEYPGIPERSLAQRVAQRELRVHASGLKRFRLKFDRRAYRVVEGSVIKVSSTKHNVSEMILRVGEVDRGKTDDSTIQVRAMEDVFGMPASAFQTPVDNGWNPPSQDAAPATATRLIEAGYRDILKRMGPTNIGDVDPTDAYIGQLAQSPGYAYQYDLLSKTDAEASFVKRATGSFTYRAELASSVSALATSIVLTSMGGISADNVGEALLLGNEIVRLDGVDEGTLTLTVARGCADTIPAAHAAGGVVWTQDDDLTTDFREYASGEVVETKVLTRTTSDLLAEADAATDSVTLASRHYKPFPPGNVTVDGQSIYAATGEHPEPVIAWTDRDRVTQEDTLIEHGAGSVGPEPGTTYTIRVKTPDGATTLRTDTAAVSPWTYDAAMQTADAVTTSTVLVELESVRDGVTSWQMYSFVIRLRGGYGYGYGLNYGGA